jgi:hypothetical protein
MHNTWLDTGYSLSCNLVGKAEVEAAEVGEAVVQDRTKGVEMAMETRMGPAYVFGNAYRVVWEVKGVWEVRDVDSRYPPCADSIPLD